MEMHNPAHPGEIVRAPPPSLAPMTIYCEPRTCFCVFGSLLRSIALGRKPGCRTCAPTLTRQEPKTRGEWRNRGDGSLRLLFRVQKSKKFASPESLSKTETGRPELHAHKNSRRRRRRIGHSWYTGTSGRDVADRRSWQSRPIWVSHYVQMRPGCPRKHYIGFGAWVGTGQPRCLWVERPHYHPMRANLLQRAGSIIRITDTTLRSSK